MLVKTETGAVHHRNAAEPSEVPVPSRRQAVVALESLMQSMLSLSETETALCMPDFETLRRVVATRY